MLRFLLLAVGLVLAASAAVAGILMLAIWGLRAGWARLTGRPMTPFIVRIDPRGTFERMGRRAPREQRRSRTPRADAAPGGRDTADVTDVQPRPPTR